MAPLHFRAVMHSTTPDIASVVEDDLKDLLPEGEERYISRFCAAIGIALLQYQAG